MRENIEEWKDTLYITDNYIQALKPYSHYKLNAFVRNATKINKTIEIYTIKYTQTIEILKMMKNSSDYLSLGYDSEKDTFVVLRAEDEDFGYVIYIYEFENEKLARECYRDALHCLDNTYTNLRYI